MPDTDGGRWNHDIVWDHAGGPGQFIPTSWRIFGGNSDGVAKPGNFRDAMHARRRRLCPEGRSADLR